MNEIWAYISMENFLIAFPWITNSMSLFGAYCLSNHNVKVGRYVGVCSSISWATYGYLIGEYSFIFANFIFFYIYASAVYKFNKKRDEYKATFEEQQTEIKKLHKESQTEIKKLHKELDKKKAAIEKDFETKQKALLKIKARARKQLEALEQITDLEELVIEDKSIPSNDDNQNLLSSDDAQLLLEDKAA